MRLDMSIRQVSGMKINTKLKLLRHEELFFPAATQNPRPAREEKTLPLTNSGSLCKALGEFVSGNVVVPKRNDDVVQD